MHSTEITKIHLPSGFKVDVSTDLYHNEYSDFTESQYFSFNNFINAGSYFPQIMQFITVLIAILYGHTHWLDILLCNIISGTAFTLIWFWAHLYKVPGLSFVSCLIGGNIFRCFLHFVPLAIVAFLTIKDWKVLLFCIIGGFLASIVKSVLFVRLSSVKYNNKILKYVASFIYKK